MNHDHPVKHLSNSIVITIPTVSPAATHRRLMLGINDAVRYYLTNPEKFKDNDGLLALLELQKSLMPGEQELSKGY